MDTSDAWEMERRAGEAASGKNEFKWFQMSALLIFITTKHQCKGLYSRYPT